MRLQRRKHITRSIHLCDRCLESLLAIDLNDLFVKFGETLKDQRWRISSKRGFHNIEVAGIDVITSKPTDNKVKLEIYLTIVNRFDNL